MAFNPFHSFRKHRRVVFAVLTIICMVTFVFTGIGAGSGALDALMRLVGSSYGQGKEVLELNGDAVYERELQIVNEQRRMVNLFMDRAMQQAANNVAVEASRQIEEARKRGQETDELYSAAASYARAGVVALRIGEQAIPLFGSSAESHLNRLLQDKNNPGLEPYVASAIHLGRYFSWKQFRAIDGKDSEMVSFFGGSSGNNQDALNFLAWKAQAKKLGIELTDEDARLMINNLIDPRGQFLTGNADQESQMIRETFTGRQEEFNRADLYRGFNDELCVSLAKLLVLGDQKQALGGGPGQTVTSPSYRGSLPSLFPSISAATPSDMLQEYRKQRTNLTLAVLSIPVEKFIDNQATPPSDSELKAIFDRFKKKVPDPTRWLPAFKIPRKMQVEWVSGFPMNETAYPYGALGAFPMAGHVARWQATPEVKFYRQQAGQLVAGMVASGNPWAWATLTRMAQQELRQIRGALSSLGPLAAPGLDVGEADLAIITAGVNRPQVAAALIGRLAVPGLGAAVSAQSVPVGYHKHLGSFLNEEIQQERQRRAAIRAAERVSAFLQPGLAKLGHWQRLLEQQTVPDRTVRAEVMARMQTLLASELLDNNLARLKEQVANVDKELEKLWLPANEAMRNALIDHWVDGYRLNRYHGRATQLSSKHDVKNDPELSPLLHGFNASSITERLRDRAGDEAFGVYLFDSGNPNVSLFGGKEYEPQPLNVGFGADGQEYLMWKIKSSDAREPSFEDARQDVIAAWRLEQARTKARKKAEEIRNALQGKSFDDVKSTMNQTGLNLDLKMVDHGTKSFFSLLEGVGRETPDPLHVAVKAYKTYVIPSDVIQYPLDNFVSKALKEKPQAVFFDFDKPQQNVYVVYVRDRSVPRAADVYKKLQQRSEVPATDEPADRQAWRSVDAQLWRTVENERKRALIDMLVKQLRKQSGAVNEDGQFKLLVQEQSSENNEE